MLLVLGLAACSERSLDRTLGNPDAAASGGAAGGTSADAGTGGAAPVDPAISRAWSWQACGQLAPEVPDRAAFFDGAGRIVVLGPGGVRVHDAAGTLMTPSSGASADFLVAAGGSVFAGDESPGQVTLTAVGANGAPLVISRPASLACGDQYALVQGGAYLVARGGVRTCAWRTSNGSLAGVLDNPVATVDATGFLSLVFPSSTTAAVVRTDFQGKELARYALSEPINGFTDDVIFSSAGDRAVIGRKLFDLTTGALIPWESEPEWGWSTPALSSSGDVLLAGGGAFRLADGKRVFRFESDSRLAMALPARDLAVERGLVLAAGQGRTTLFDVKSKGVKAVLGAPSHLEERPLSSSHLAVSADGSLLLHTLQNAAVYGIRPAPSFSASEVSWAVREVEVALASDVSPDGKRAATGGDGQALFDTGDGHSLWPSPVPDPELTNCTPDHIRFSPKGTWLAGSSYKGTVRVFMPGDASGVGWKPWLELPGTCDAVAFSRDERLMATSSAVLYRTASTAAGWEKVWATDQALPSSEVGPFDSNDVVFSPDQRSILVSRCRRLGSGCVAALLDAATGEVTRTLPPLVVAYPSFSPEGSWVAAGPTLLHLPSGETRTLGPDPEATGPAIFMPNGDIVTGSATGTLTRYCRSP